MSSDLLKVIRRARLYLIGLQEAQADFLGRMALSIPFIEDPNIPTYSTNGQDIRVNPSFAASLTTKENAFVIAHEILHIALEHLFRLENRDPTLWNVATDYAINGLLVSQNIGDIPKDPQTGQPAGFFSYEYSKKTAEEIYEILEKSNINTARRFLDGHEYPATTAEMAQQGLEKVRILVQQCAGSDLTQTAIWREIVKSKKFAMFDWKNLLQHKISHHQSNFHTYSRPHRRSWNGNIEITVVVCLDTSGSISDDVLKEFLDEVLNICDVCRNITLHVWCFDTQVRHHRTFTRDNLSEVSDYIPCGGGGTIIRTNWRYLDAAEIDPDVIVVMTDFFDSENIEAFHDERFDTIWVIRNNPKAKPSFGSVCKY
jgi:predicted metal-dependent peptidase